MDIILELLFLLIVVRAGSELAERLGHSPSVGEIGAGVLLAALTIPLGEVIPFIRDLPDSQVLDVVANTGIFFLVLMAGIEMRPKEIAQRRYLSMGVAAGGMLVPLAAGGALAWFILPASDSKGALSLLVGIALSISAIPATVKIFGEFNLLHHPIGETVVAAAIFDDVAGIILLAILTALIRDGAVPSAFGLLLLLGKVALFFVITTTLGAKVYPVVSRGLKKLKAAAHEFSTLIIVCLAYAFLAEILGLHWILGAFMAGLYFSPTRVGQEAYDEMYLTVAAIGTGVLGPLFFASIGLRIDISAVGSIPLFILALIAIAFMGKIVGAGLPAWLGGMKPRDATAVGIGLSARGAIELVILSIAEQAGLFRLGNGDPVVGNLFSALALMAVATTILTPILLRSVLKDETLGQPPKDAL